MGTHEGVGRRFNPDQRLQVGEKGVRYRLLELRNMILVIDG